VTERDRPVSPAEALHRLVDGNHRFVNELTSMRARLTGTREWRARLAEGQAPFATVMTCSDSRVPAEIIFDQGLGDLFVVRNAGTVMGAAPLASVEFAVAELGTRLVLVLGHEGCGAFRAALKHMAGVPAASESLRELVARIEPCLRSAGEHGTVEERIERAIDIHVADVARRVAESPLIRPLVEDGKVLVVPAHYRMAAGVVEVGAPVAMKGRGGAADVAA
jgi:carbonic anhydrase